MTTTTEQRACELNPDAWFNPKMYEMAKAACAPCPIRSECEEIGWGSEFGVFGGLDEHDRRRLDPERFQEEVHQRQARVRKADRDERSRPTRLCSIQGCKGIHDANGLCAKHWQRKYVHGDPMHEPFSDALKNSTICVMPGCGRPYASKDYCKRHYNRWAHSGDVFGGKDHMARSDQQHAEIHRLLALAVKAWHETKDSNTTCVELVQLALEEANRTLTRGELDVIHGMGVKLAIDIDQIPPVRGIAAEEMLMRYQAILQMISLGESRKDVARQLGVSTRTVDRAMRAITTGAAAKATPRYRVTT